MPRRISALASPNVLPFSSVMMSRKFVDVFVEQIFQFEKILNSFARRRAPPCRKRVGGGLNSRVDIGFRGERSARDELIGGGIRDVEESRVPRICARLR